MSTTMGLDTLRARAEARKAAALDELVAAATRVAAGESIDAGAVELAMRDAGVPLDEFERWAGVARRRQELHATVARRPAATAKRAKAQAGLDKAVADFEAVQTAFFARAAELRDELTALDGTLADADRAAAQLTDPRNLLGALADRLRDAEKSYHAAAEKFEAVDRQRRDFDDKVRAQRGMAATAADAFDREEYERKAKNTEWTLREITEQHTAAAAELAAAKKTLEETRAAAVRS